MAKVTDFKKLKQRQARRRAFKLAGLAGVILAIAYLLSSLVNSPEFAGLSSLGDMIKGGARRQNQGDVPERQRNHLAQ